MIQNVFNRYEKKYMLTETQYCAIRKRLEEYMEEDQYGLHTIQTTRGIVPVSCPT